MRNIFELEDNMFEYLKSQVTSLSKFNPRVLKTVVEDKYPLVVFSVNSNKKSYQTQDYSRLDRCRKIAIEILIFAKDIGDDNSHIVCEELAQIVDDVIGVRFGLNGGIAQKLDNINSSQVSEFILHYDCEWVMNTNKIY